MNRRGDFVRNEGAEVILLNDMGYRLAGNQADLTPLQKIVLIEGAKEQAYQREKAIQANKNR